MLNLFVAQNITKFKHRFPLRQLRKLPRLLKRTWPIFVLSLLTGLLIYLNYEPGTYLTGWDNLHPEYNIENNLFRSFFSVWQEYRSLGLLAGMAPSADFPRLILIAVLLHNNLPLDLCRYLATFLPLLLGPLGVYFLFYHHIFRDHLDSKTTQFASFFGALFYLLNLNTLQTFFVPFETFTWFYGSLPWIFYFLLAYFQIPSTPSLITLAIISLISAPSFYVETIYIVLFLILFPFFLEYYQSRKFSFTGFKKVTSSFLSLVLPHLFWLLPVIFFVIYGAKVTEQARINVISSPETYSRNLQFANLKDLALLKGYLFNYLDLTANFKYDFLLSIWRNHINNPIISVIGYASFFLIIIGLYYSLKKHFPWTAAFLGSLFFCLFFLLGGGLLINNAIPLVGELFRSPFTKFSIPLSLFYSFFFSVGTIFLLDLFTFLHSKYTFYLTLFTITIALILYMSPAFSGNLISPSMRRSLPQEYLDLFSYLNTQDKSSRIANFPQHDFWGWLYYDWGYRGSGFLWEGIKQPLLDRAFDVWNLSSEKYYEEISSALYSNNQSLFEELLDRYDVQWILLDKHVVAADGTADLGVITLENFLNKSKHFTPVKNFSDKLYLFKVNSTHPSKNFLSLSNSLPTSYPFRELTLRPDNSWIYKSDFLSTSLTINRNTPQTLHLPSLTDSETLLPVRVEYQRYGGSLNLRLTPTTPTFFLNDTQYDLSSQSIDLTLPIGSNSNNYILQLDHSFFEINLPVEIPQFSTFYFLTTAYLPSQNSFTVSLYNGNPDNTYDLTGILSQSEPAQCYVSKPNHKIEKITTPDSVTLIGTDVIACLSTPLPTISSDNLISYSFTYSSPTLTQASVNISGKDFLAEEIPASLEPHKEPQSARAFVKSTGKYQQINLVLEAGGTKAVQETTYQNIIVGAHPSLFNSSLRLPHIPDLTLPLAQNNSRLQVSLPITKSQYDLVETPAQNSLFPENRNCDQFNSGDTVKKVSASGILYQSRNAIECDDLNLRTFPHSLNYLLSFDYIYSRGLPLSVCLENYTTRRCDIYERLTDTKTIQSLINPTANPQEAPGYSLHLFTQSIGNQISSGIIKSLSVHPIPLKFLHNISLQSPVSYQSTTDFSSSHPAEFLYTLNLPANNSETHLNLFQSFSPHWQAIIIPESDTHLPTWLLSLKLPYYGLNARKLSPVPSTSWYNSWTIPAHDSAQSIAIVYFPQYLQFAGYFIIPFYFIYLVFSPTISFLLKRKTHHKKAP